MALRTKRHAIAFLLLLALVFLIYSNSLNGSWHLDDLPNITRNTRLHISNLSVDSLVGSFFAKPASSKPGQLYRPVACLTFALNWYLGGPDVRGYHVVNISIHLLTAFFLYLTILQLAKTPNLKKRYADSEYFIALLAAALWALNPLHTQAVDYIVQRMATLAAMFYMLAVYLYLKARMNNSPVYRGLLFSGCIVSYFLALGSKENAAVLPFCLLLLEVVFFQDSDRPETEKRLFRYAAAGAFFAFLTMALFFLKGDIFAFINGYADRPFSLGQRLLTEPRILVFHLTQLFLPLPSRLSIQHDVVVSTSLLTPWTTLPAIVLVILLITWGIANIKKRPLVAFGILFFFLNHLVESTVLPLELIFEHRNYLPSLFVFLPVAAGVKKALDWSRQRHLAVYRFVAVLVVFIMTGLGAATYTRNAAWLTRSSLWQDARIKAPNSARPLQNIADEYKKKGQYEMALELYRQALSLGDPKPKQSQALSFNNMGIIYAQQGQLNRGIEFYRKALNVYPGHERALHNLTVALVNAGRWAAASQSADLLLSKYEHERYLNLKGFILLKQHRPAEAEDYLLKALKISPQNRNAAVNLAMAYSQTGRYEIAERILQQLNKRYPHDMTVLLCLIENSVKTGNKSKTDFFISDLLSAFSVGSLKLSLEQSSTPNRLIPYSRGQLAPIIAAKLKEKANQIKNPLTKEDVSL